MKSISAIHPAITENTENMLVKHASHISIRESHNTLDNSSISAMSNLFHNILAWHNTRNTTAIFMSRTEVGFPM